MTPNEINRAIALHLGWIPCPKRDCKNHWTNPCGTESNLPDYCGDLNAMHEAENVLDDNSWEAYWCALARITPGRPTSVCHATAAQRAEAFLRTVGKWEERMLRHIDELHARAQVTVIQSNYFESIE